MLPAARHSRTTPRAVRAHLRARGLCGFLRLAADETALRTRARLTDSLLAHAGRTGRPVLVGPFLGEVGFEVLYWIPLVRRLMEEHRIGSEDVLAVSRGGCASWYGDLATRYVDALDLLGPEKYARQLAERRRAAGDQKQVRALALDRRLAAAARRRARFPRAAIRVHPAVMHSRLRDIWAGRRPAADLEQFVRFETLDAPEPAPVAVPGGSFVALKAYWSQAYPETEQAHRWVLELATVLSGRLRIVNPVNRTSPDGHAEVMADPEAVDQIDVGRDASTNLALQSSVFARAAAAVTTYGGMAYVPLLHGVPTVGLRAADGDNPVHLEVARLAATRLGGVLKIVDIRQTTPNEAAELVAALAGDDVAARRV
jgi:hypothetical protein